MMVVTGDYVYDIEDDDNGFTMLMMTVRVVVVKMKKMWTRGRRNICVQTDKLAGKTYFVHWQINVQVKRMLVTRLHPRQHWREYMRSSQLSFEKL